MSKPGSKPQGLEMTFSRRRKKALDKRKCTQRGNALDTIVFTCLARLFMHESSFLLLLEICQSFKIFQPGSSTLSSIHTETCIESNLAQSIHQHSPPLSHTTLICVHTGFRGPTAISALLPSCPHSPWLLHFSLLHMLISKPFHQVLLAH